jgi:hypothetical protein
VEGGKCGSGFDASRSPRCSSRITSVIARQWSRIAGDFQVLLPHPNGRRRTPQPRSYRQYDSSMSRVLTRSRRQTFVLPGVWPLTNPLFYGIPHQHPYLFCLYPTTNNFLGRISTRGDTKSVQRPYEISKEGTTTTMLLIYCLPDGLELIVTLSSYRVS